MLPGLASAILDTPLSVGLASSRRCHLPSASPQATQLQPGDALGADVDGGSLPAQLLRGLLYLVQADSRAAEQSAASGLLLAAAHSVLGSAGASPERAADNLLRWLLFTCWEAEPQCSTRRSWLQPCTSITATTIFALFSSSATAQRILLQCTFAQGDRKVPGGLLACAAAGCGAAAVAAVEQSR